jgi:hypothetical protein
LCGETTIAGRRRRGTTLLDQNLIIGDPYRYA